MRTALITLKFTSHVPLTRTYALYDVHTLTSQEDPFPAVTTTVPTQMTVIVHGHRCPHR